MNILEALAKLAVSGLSQKAIAAAVGSSQSTINRAMHGKDIRFSTGKSIIELAERTVAECAAIVPPDMAGQKGDDNAVFPSSIGAR